jgi:hypothetical protein
MNMYTESLIDELIGCEKIIVDPPAKSYREDRGNLKKNFSLCSTDTKYVFSVFIRQNKKFIENFSIGMDYNPRDEKGKLCIIRCNGAHGESKVFPHHSINHIHIATAKTINEGLKPECNIERINDYFSFEEAVQFFITRINISVADRNKFFPLSENQIEMSIK